MIRRPRPAPSATALVLAGLVGLTGCAAGGSAEAGASAGADAGPPQDGGTLDIAFWPDNPTFTCIDPFQTYWLEHRTLIRNFADSLTDQDPDTGEVVPWLATDWQVADDGLSYTFDLRDGVTFSDGEVLDATAVKTSLDSAAATLVELPAAYGGVYLEGYAGTDVVDDDTVTVRFSTPNAGFLQATSTTNLAIIAPASAAKTPEERCLGDVVGSGPFVLDSYTPNESTHLTRRDGYAWGSPLREGTGQAHLDAIDVTYVAEDSVRLGNLTSGAIDIAWPRNPFTPEEQAQLEASGADVLSRSLPGPAYNLYPNTTGDRPLADPLVREALQHSVDRATYAATIYGEDYPVVESAYDATTPGVVAQTDALALDTTAAADLLDEAGWALGADGYREKDGQRLTLSLAVSTSTPGDVLLQDQLKQVGIDLQIRVFVASERADLISSGNYDLLATYYTRADAGVLQWILDPRHAGSKAFATNAQSPEDLAEVQALFDAGTTETDPASRDAVYADLQELLVDRGIAFPLFERVQRVGVAADVHGVRLTSEAFGDFADTWIEG